VTQGATAATPDPLPGAVTTLGLTTTVARARLAAEGANELPRTRQPQPLGLLLRQLTHLLAILLWVAAGLALLAGMPPLAVAIVAVVVLNGVFAFLQEYRADRSTRRLRNLLPTSVRVVRDGVRHQVPAVELVRGDLVVLEAGTRVPADLRVVTAHGLALDESLVTGESGPYAAVPATP